MAGFEPTTFGLLSRCSTGLRSIPLLRHSRFCLIKVACNKAPRHCKNPYRENALAGFSQNGSVGRRNPRLRQRNFFIKVACNRRKMVLTPNEGHELMISTIGLSPSLFANPVRMLYLTWSMTEVPLHHIHFLQSCLQPVTSVGVGWTLENYGARYRRSNPSQRQYHLKYTISIFQRTLSFRFRHCKNIKGVRNLFA